MNILQIAPPWIDVPPKGYGGTEWVIYNLVKGLVHSGHKVTLFGTKNSIVPGNLKYVYEKGLVDLELPWEAGLPPLLHYHQAFKLAANFDIAHAHLSSQTDLLVLPFLADLADAGIPAVMTIHGHQPFDRFSDWDLYYFKYYASKVRIITISRTMELASPSEFIKAGVIYNSLDCTTIDFKEKSGDYLTWIGKIIPEKGLKEAILTAKEAGEQFIFAGVVDSKQPKSIEYFKQEVESLIDGQQIQFIGPADLSKKNRLLGGAKAFLNPIDWEEPFGMVMVESMAAGTPVISYARGAAKELIVDSETGYLVKNRKEMLESIKKLDRIARFNCRKHVENNFSIRKATEDHLKVYKKIIRATEKYTHNPIRNRTNNGIAVNT